MSTVSLLDSRNRWGSWHRGANSHPLASLHNLMVKISIYVFEAVALNGSFLHTQGILFTSCQQRIPLPENRTSLPSLL